MLRSYAMVQETHVTMRYKRSLSHRGRAETTRDDGSGEEHSDTCCRGGCKRMAIWFRDATHGYCTPHWKDYIRNRQATTDALENGLCVQCKKVEAVKWLHVCSECLSETTGKGTTPAREAEQGRRQVLVRPHSHQRQGHLRSLHSWTDKEREAEESEGSVRLRREAVRGAVLLLRLLDGPAPGERQKGRGAAAGNGLMGG